MNKNLLEARDRVETAILEAGQGTPRGGHRHWGVYGSRAAWEREKRDRMIDANIKAEADAIKQKLGLIEE